MTPTLLPTRQSDRASTAMPNATTGAPIVTAGRPPRLGATLALCALSLAGFAALAGHLTHGFEAWTFEALRRQAAMEGKLVAPALALRDAQGRSFQLFDASAVGSPVYLVDFVYTRCMTVCAALGSEYQQMQRAMSANPSSRVRLLSISIDPAHDNARALLAYGNRHQADPARWTLAAPRDEAAGQAALRQFGLIAIPDGFGGYVHNGGIHLIDAQGKVHGIFDYGQWPQALKAANRLAEGAPQ
ncbi:SCO family protein [Cupriavidus sp. YR651]|uniref:SCO family protein n=1 Tax=Cupriavidus sp. YR651 TaxID=1855315 RepID=UPI000B82582F|nr:SCO family protein [Cupriavidus sp. YR651]